MRFLVTAGPTHEPIDAVRYLGNRSSGRMGIAIAEAAAAAGLEVTLLLGPVLASPPADRVNTVEFRTTADLRDLLARFGPWADVVIMAAAVADFRPVALLPHGKLERGSTLRLDLEPTPDLLAELAQRRRKGQFLVGFALEEPRRLEERALAKLGQKGIDAIVANPLVTMDANDIEGVLFLADGRVIRPDTVGTIDQRGPIDKRAFARWLVATIVDLQAHQGQR